MSVEILDIHKKLKSETNIFNELDYIE
jgi:hypothetical protein